MDLPLTLRDAEFDDLVDLDWSGGPEHLHTMAEAVAAAYAGEAVVLVGELANGRLVASGAVTFTVDPEAAVLWMLVVHERLQSLGIGGALVRALEDRIVAHGRSRARLTVELDNPPAASFYRRHGYREVGPALDCWPVAGGRTYVAAVTVLERELTAVRPG